MKQKIRKFLAFPFAILGSFLLISFLIVTLIKCLINGRSLDYIGGQLDELRVGFEAAANEENAIIELVEKHHGSGKAMQVASILQEEDGDCE